MKTLLFWRCEQASRSGCRKLSWNPAAVFQDIDGSVLEQRVAIEVKMDRFWREDEKDSNVTWLCGLKERMNQRILKFGV